MISGKQKRDVQVQQGAVQFSQQSMVIENRSAFIAQVIETFSQRMTCNLKTVDGQILYNIPVMTHAGLIGGRPYGTVNLPAVKDYVVVLYASYGTRHKVIIGTIVPYLAQEFSKAPVNSDNKQFATAMLDSNKPLEYKRIFKSGTSILVEEDGTLSVETPSGAFIRLSESENKILIKDSNGNTITMESGESEKKVVINGHLEVLQ